MSFNPVERKLYGHDIAAVPPMMPSGIMPYVPHRPEERIALPGSIRGRMPDLMSAIVDDLMPYRMGAVIPLVVPSMIDYLRGEGR